MADLIITWEDYHRHIEQLAAQIARSPWEFDQILCIAKGGLRIGDILSRLFDRSLAILTVASYRDRQQKQLYISQHPSMIGNKLGDRLLIVDDLIDNSHNLEQTIHWVTNYQTPAPTEIKTAVLWYKAQSCITPDYYVQHLFDNPWIQQPFEKYEHLTPTALIQSQSP